jgi:hypothetical protein
VTKDEVRQLAEASLEQYIRLNHPTRALGSMHGELCQWLTRQDAKQFQLVLLPRDHMKSYVAGMFACQAIDKNPAIRILYVSSTSNLATKQLKAIKDVLTSDIHRYYWPDLVNKDEGKREKWTETEISVDHPKRKYENVRDPTVFTAGTTTSVTGMHCDLMIIDDLVVLENAYTEEGREKISLLYSLLASVAGTDCKVIVVGTRYHPLDLYGELLAKMVQHFNEEGVLTHEEPLYEVFERKVESVGDGSGEFLWPRQQNKDGRWFGFNREILEIKKSNYIDRVQFRAQYYNDPNDGDTNAISRDLFQYYDKRFLVNDNGTWRLNGKRLNVYAAVDFAYTINPKSDFSSMVVIGIDSNWNYYILDIDRFKTKLIPEMYSHLLALYNKWGFHKVKAEVTAGQIAIVNDLKYSYIIPNGLALSVEEFRPIKSKPDRMLSVLQPRYFNRQMWHYRDGNCQILEDELVLSNPPHDDVKDALAFCIEGCMAPAPQLNKANFKAQQFVNSRFGGMGGRAS